MKAPIDVKFWDERERAPHCLTVVTTLHPNGHFASFAFVPADQSNHERLSNQFYASQALRKGTT